ncbi:hypothetical protein SAMN05428969_3005 [Devosia sp. YR412]|nr:hypothetical protein SAMN05428969_3005 [Devosia sp. YR412]
MLIGVGSALLFDQLGYEFPNRWIFLVLLVPGGVAVADGTRLAGREGWSDVKVLSRLIAGSLFGLIGGVMSLGLDSGLILPALIVMLGAGTILRAVRGAGRHQF